MPTHAQIADVIRRFLATEAPQRGGPSFYTDDRALLSTGVLDSITITRLITFLEDTYPVEFMAWELSIDYLDTVGLIAGTVCEKLA